MMLTFVLGALGGVALFFTIYLLVQRQVRPYKQALDYIHDRLCKLEKKLGDDIGDVENARLLHLSIEACKYLKQPEWNAKFK